MRGSREGDFLKKDVRTSLCATYLAAGVHLRIETNSESILQIAQQSFEQTRPDIRSRDEIRLRLWVEAQRPCATRSKPYFRGLGNLVFSGFDDRSSLMINLRDRSGAGRFSPELAGDARFWKTVVFPSFLTVVGPSVGLTSLHCACVAWKGRGLLLVGESGSGKSSLSLALAQRGFDFLSDDRTLISDREGHLVAWALSTEMKQRADAIAHFPALRNIGSSEMCKGEPVFRFDPGQLFGVTQVQSCEPRWVVFLERQSRPSFSLSAIFPEEAARRLQQDLHQESSETAERQQRTINALSGRECCSLRYGGNPQTIAGALRHLIAGQLKPIKTFLPPQTEATVRTHALPSDPLRRFRATSLRSNVSIMGRTIRLETDSPLVLKHASEVLSSFQPVLNGSPQFLWRIVCEPREEPQASWPVLTAFSDRSVRYINMGQRSFIAVDLDAREAVGFLPEYLARNETGFSSVYLASLLHLTAPALGLIAVSAACVGKGERGLLLFGPPSSGKTTSSYWARKLGLDFHSDQAAFLELDAAGAVRAWGGFWPAAFRADTARFLPELSSVRSSFSHLDKTFLCMDKNSLCPGRSSGVIPVACIFLERGSAVGPRLIPISSQEVAEHVLTDAGSKEDRDTVSRLLRELPSYRLLYGEDPHIAALFFRSILNAHQLMEGRT